MNVYTIALFLHVVGALGLFIALGLQWTSLRQIQGATTSEQIRESMRMYKGVGRFGMASMLMVLVFGIYMAVVAWRGAAWTAVALGSVVLIIIIMNVLSRPRIAAIERTLTTEKGPLSPALHNLANDSRLWISMETRIAIALGIIFLMTAKPNMVGSLLTIGVAIVLGLALSLPMVRRKRAQERPVG